MPYPAGHKDKIRAQIVTAARQEMNRTGYQAASIDAIMAAAGLTRGGFYAHFSSKEDLLVEIMKNMQDEPLPLFASQLKATAAIPDGPCGARAFIDAYLSPEHRDRVDQGCSVPPLSPEIERSGDKVRDAFDDYARDVARKLTVLKGTPTGEDGIDDSTIGMLALCVGGIVLSRAVKDEGLSDRILAACRNEAKTL